MKLLLQLLLALISPVVRERFEAPAFTYDVSCVAADGTEKWRETVHNLVTTEGKNNIIDNQFKASGFTAAWYLGLKGTGTIAAGDTLASHPGWSEVTPYSGNRPAIAFGTTAGGSNTAGTVTIPVTGSATIAGAFICSVSAGTSGKLYSLSDFPSSRTVASGDTLNIIPTVSAT
jgi:hypothetical protein